MINLFDTYMYLHVVFLAADELTGFSIYSGASLERPPYWPQKCGLWRQVIFDGRFNYI